MDALAAMMDSEPESLDNLLCSGGADDEDYDPALAYMEACWGMCE